MLKVHSVSDVPAYRRVRNEDGAYDAFIGYNVLAASTDDEGYVSTFVYVGRIREAGAYVFSDLEAAQRFIARVESAGCIDADGYWDCVGVTHRDELPDYVTNWWRPEYN